tara:strand:- start:342 stop:611 length:270 start_codon:yes stop_codon:yes gene_type:complete
MKKVTLSVAALTIAMMSYGQTQCNGVTKDSVQCKNTTKTEVKLCYLHNPNYVKAETKSTTVCSGTTKSGRNCKNKTKDLSGKCHNHRND